MGTIKIVIGVSGGPDSIYLLNQLHNNHRYEPIVVHVNYHLRESSDEEQKFVEDFCKERNIQIIVKDVTVDDWEKYSYLSNKQSMAREIRYDEYIKVAQYNNCKDIFIAHHKDDFIETAIMQEERSSDYLFYGIKQLTHYKGLRIHRPLMNKYKEEILDELDAQGMEYKLDMSNYEPIYERNRVRISLLDKTKEEKEEIFNRFVKINEKNEHLEDSVEKEYMSFKESGFSWDVFNEIENKKQVVYKWLIDQDERVNISSDKIDGIIEFLSNKRGDKSYRLMKNIFMSVKNSKIIIYTN